MISTVVCAIELNEKNQDPNQQNLCSAPALLASFRSLWFFSSSPKWNSDTAENRSAGSSAALLTWSATLHPDAAVELLVDSLALGHKFMMHNLIVEFVGFFNCRVSLCRYLWLGAPPVGLELWTLPLTTAVRSLSSPGDDPQHKNWVILMQKSRFPLCTSLKSVVRS